MRSEPATSQVVTVSAADPLNLAGIVVPGEKIPAISGRFVAFRDGVAVEASASNMRASALPGFHGSTDAISDYADLPKN
jgi:ATP-dependent Lhr-like helicase